MAGSVGEDELAFWCCEVPVGDVDGDALLTFGAQAVGQQCQVDVVGAALFAGPLDGLQLVLEDLLGVVEHSSDQGALAIIDRSGRSEPDEFHRH